MSNRPCTNTRPTQICALWLLSSDPPKLSQWCNSQQKRTNGSCTLWRSWTFSSWPSLNLLRPSVKSSFLGEGFIICIMTWLSQIGPRTFTQVTMQFLDSAKHPRCNVYVNFNLSRRMNDNHNIRNAPLSSSHHPFHIRGPFALEVFSVICLKSKGCSGTRAS